MASQTPSLPPSLHPASASWLNQIERWFAEITNRQIRRGSYRSTRELVQAIEDYLAVYNEDPKPFVWTKSADDILESLRVTARESPIHDNKTGSRPWILPAPLLRSS